MKESSAVQKMSIIPVAGNPDRKHLGEMSVAKGCSLTFNYAGSNKNGVRSVTMLPRFESKESSNIYQAKDPNNPRKDKLALIKEPLAISEIEQFTLTLYEHIYGVQKAKSSSFSSGSQKITLRRHVTYKERKPQSVFHSIHAMDSSKKTGINISVNKLTLRNMARIFSNVCSLESVFPIQVNLGEGSTRRRAAGTFLVKNGSIQIITDDQNVPSIRIENAGRDALAFMVEQSLMWPESQPMPETVVRGHVLNKRSISFYSNKVKVQFNVTQNLALLLHDTLSI